MNVPAIPTQYAGCRFRSRLEARWAVFFDAAGWAWDYEPEGYQTRPWYLPDFLLRHPAGDRWVEIKPLRCVPEAAVEDSRWIDLARGTGLPVHVAYGIHRPGDGCAPGRTPTRHAGRIVLPSGRSTLHHTIWTDPAHDTAWTRASAARFEHGESGLR